jgi:two-component system CheB/CheR fusion protein
MERTEAAAWSEENGDALICTLLAKGCPYGAVFLDLQGLITGLSGGACTLSGYCADDVIGKSFAVLFTPEDVARELPAHELRTALTFGSAEDERWHVRKDGSRFWASGLTLPMRAGGEVYGYAKLFRDATPLKLRLDALENDVERMRRERRERDAFVATIAHELRNPLQPMTIATTLLTHPSEQQRHEQALKILKRQLGFMERLVEDLLDLTRVSQAKLQLDYQTVELQALVTDAVESCRGQAEARPVSLVCVVPSVPLTVEVDPARFSQVIVNLITNAIKFTPSGGKVGVWASVDESQFIVKVQDTGRGIAPHMQARIFEMFTQVDGSETARGKGLGIGLALVQEIVALHRGTVEVRSEGVGKGSEFFIRVPLSRPAD